MASSGEASALEIWFKSQKGTLNPDIHIASSDTEGFHFRAAAPIPSGSSLCSAPHSTSLSYLNALVDDAFPVFQARRQDFTIEAIGFWYLMAQYINRENSFWRHYLESLPSPEGGIPTALAFLLDDATEDREWVEGTDVLHTAQGRFEVYEKYYAAGLPILKESGINIEPYTWHLFLWAISMFTSRSFSSRALRPADGNKYWATYKTSPSDPSRRQTVLLDMSHTSAEDLDFSVLFPVIDAGNHNPNASAEWSFDAGRFGIMTHDTYEAGSEVFNNYGTWKSNAELLMGYGFCLPENKADHVLLTPKAPSDGLQQALRTKLPGYFTPEGQWWGAKATFHLPLVSPPSAGSERDVFGELPEPLLELLVYILRDERGLPFTFIEHPKAYLTDPSSEGSRYLPFVARVLVGSLAPKMAKVQPPMIPDGAPKEPSNNLQRQAAIYCEGQLNILQSIITALKSFTRSLLRPSLKEPRFVTLEGLLELCADSLADEVKVGQFLQGIAASAGSADLEALRAAGWEDDVVVLLLCAAFIWSQDTKGVIVWPEWVDPAALGMNKDADGDSEMEGETAEQVQSLMALVQNAAQSCPDSIWTDSRWSSKLIIGLGGMMVARESMMMMVPSGRGEEARFVVYLHA